MSARARSGNTTKLRLRVSAALSRNFIPTLMAAILLTSVTARGEEVTLPAVSDETDAAVCPSGFAISQLRCTGSYCDNIIATCLRFAPDGYTPIEPPQWSEWFSEEMTWHEFPDGFPNWPPSLYAGNVIVGFQCDGSYCDSVRLLEMKIRPRTIGDPEVVKLDTIDLSNPNRAEDNRAYDCKGAPNDISEENGGADEGLSPDEKSHWQFIRDRKSVV